MIEKGVQMLFIYLKFLFFLIRSFSLIVFFGIFYWRYNKFKAWKTRELLSLGLYILSLSIKSNY